MARGTKYREADLPTHWSEDGARTIDPDPAPGLEPAGEGPVPGDVLKERFLLLECVAHGPAGRLFLASDRQRQAAGHADARVALKVVTAPPGAEPRALQALRREVAIARGLDHSNLPRIIGLHDDGPHTFLCMEWLAGESLGAILDSRGARPMTRVQALHIVDGVCRALNYLHSRGITHADVKPGNILVSPEGNATLLDFGVSLGPGANALPDLRGHTPEYASPQVLGSSPPTPADDLFSVACVAYRMLSGHRPFGAGNARDAEAAGARPPQPENLSPVQWRALDRALAFGRAERQPDVATFLAQLKGVRDESAAITGLAGDESVSSTSPARGGQRDYPRYWPVAAIVLVTVAGGAGYQAREWATRPTPVVTAGPSGAVPAGPPLPAAPAASRPMTASALQPAAARSSAPPRPAAQRVPPEAARRQPDPGPPPRARPASPTRAPALVAAATAASPPAAGGAGVDEPDATPAAAATVTPEPAGARAGTAVSARSVPFSSLAVRRLVEPDYPRRAAARRVAGWVDVAFSVDDSGQTRDVRVINADPPGVFDDAALRAVRRWRFDTPDAGADGEALSSEIRVRFDPRKTRLP